MTYLLDTNVVSDFVRGELGVHARLTSMPPRDLAISVITEMEIEYGLLINPGRTRKIEPLLRLVLGSVAILPYSSEDAKATANVRAALRRAGRPVGPYDALLAGCALSRQLVLVTANRREFDRVSGLKVEDWRQTVS